MLNFHSISNSKCYRFREVLWPGGSDGKKSACDAGDTCSFLGLGRSPGEGNGYPLQYYGLENSMDCTVHEVAESDTILSDFHFHFHIMNILLLLLSRFSRV